MAKAVHVDRFARVYFAVLHEERPVERRYSKKEILHVHQPGHSVQDLHVATVDVTTCQPLRVQEPNCLQNLPRVQRQLLQRQRGSPLRTAILGQKRIARRSHTTQHVLQRALFVKLANHQRAIIVRRNVLDRHDVRMLHTAKVLQHVVNLLLVDVPIRPELGPGEDQIVPPAALLRVVVVLLGRGGHADLRRVLLAVRLRTRLDQMMLRGRVPRGVLVATLGLVHHLEVVLSQTPPDRPERLAQRVDALGAQTHGRILQGKICEGKKGTTA